MKLSVPNKENHRALWLWLAKHPEANKRAWPGFKTMERYDITRPVNYCFMCAVRSFDCDTNCPMRSLGERPCNREPQNHTDGKPGFYYRWEKSNDFKLRTRLALKIANCWK